ncbi:MAG: HAD family hydrolase [Anaeromassilibacillus sp.]
MMKVVGHSIAMGNAVDELKEVADYVTADILDDGTRL